jgi:hypothetical protein
MREITASLVRVLAHEFLPNGPPELMDPFDGAEGGRDGFKWVEGWEAVEGKGAGRFLEYKLFLRV